MNLLKIKIFETQRNYSKFGIEERQAEDEW